MDNNGNNNGDGSVDVDLSGLESRGLVRQPKGPNDPGFVAHPSTMAQTINAETLARVVAGAVAETFARMPQFNAQTMPTHTPTQQAPAPQTAPRPNISDRGTASPTDLRDADGVINSRPLEVTEHDLDQYLLKHGEYEGLQKFQAHVMNALKRVRIKPPSGR